MSTQSLLGSTGIGIILGTHPFIRKPESEPVPPPRRPPPPTPPPRPPSRQDPEVAEAGDATRQTFRRRGRRSTLLTQGRAEGLPRSNTGRKQLLGE